MNTNIVGDVYTVEHHNSCVVQIFEKVANCEQINSSVGDAQPSFLRRRMKLRLNCVLTA